MNDLLFIALWKRKKQLVLFVLVAIILGVLLSLLLPRQYTVSNGFRIGQFMGVPLELSEFTRQRFKQVGFIADAYEEAHLELDIPRDRYPNTVKVSIENDFNKVNNIDTVIFSTTGKTAEEALAMSVALGQKLVAVHTQKLEEGKAIRRMEVHELEKDIEKTTIELKAMEEALMTMGSKNGISDVAIFLTTAKLEEQHNLLFHMKEKLHQVNFQIDNPVESFTTEIISQPRLPENPSFPKISLMVAGLVFISFPAWIFFCWAMVQISGALEAERNEARTRKS